MKKLIIFFLFAFVIVSIASAQTKSDKSIQDSVIGWWDNNRFDDKIKPTNDPIQKKKNDLNNVIVDWMKKTYTPVGGLGTVTRQNFTTAFGVYFMVWNVSFDPEWLDEKGHFKPIPEENTPFRINANLIPGAYNIPFLKSPMQQYFTWPPNGSGYNFDDLKAKGNFDEKVHPNVYKYITRINEFVTVYLVPDNKLPFREVSIKEYLDSSEASLNAAFQIEKDKIDRQWSNPKSREEAYAFQQKESDRYRNAIKKWRQKYQSNSTAPAILRHRQPTIISEFFGDLDPFEITAYEKSSKQYYPVFKLDASTITKMKSEKPEWIAVSFPYFTKENGNQKFELYTTLTQHLNYDYIYNYFFDQQKIAGKAYTPMNEDQLKYRLATYRKNYKNNLSPVSSNTNFNNAVYFGDDFSTNATGNNPTNWYFNRYGQHATVRTIKNQSGNWLQLGYNNYTSPTAFKKPLPNNFSIEYDVVTDGNYTRRTGGGVELYLTSRSETVTGTVNGNGNGSDIKIQTIAGNQADFDNNNYMGLANMKIENKPDENSNNQSFGLSYNYDLRSFTNMQTKIHVKVTIVNGVVSLFINDKAVISTSNAKPMYNAVCNVCGIPNNTTIKNIYWKNVTQDAENINVYISNIKINKL